MLPQWQVQMSMQSQAEAPWDHWEPSGAEKVYFLEVKYLARWT